MKNLFVIILLLNFNAVYCQTVMVSGVVLDVETNKPVPYATLGIRDKNIGTVADIDGKFSFNISTTEKDELLIISSIGYIDTKVSIAALSQASQTIKLTPSVIALNEVEIRPGKVKLKVFGRTNGSTMLTANMFTERSLVSDELAKEQGTIIDIDKNCFLRDFNFHLAFNRFNVVKFRLNIYRVVNNLPDKLLIDQDIIFDVTQQKQQWIKIDLTKYHIYLKDMDKIAVTMQWLHSEKKTDQERMSFSVSGAPSAFNSILSRDKSQAKWQKRNGALSFFITADSYKN